MKPTDTYHPDYFHKVVDCQWACPAHTDVPGYIRLIAQGRFTDAYMLNRDSNVFPGILGRVCDRPCEPACRRGRVDDEKPVAICRLKRVTDDYKDDISDRLPRAPKQKNGKKIACIGAGCASLTVANDLAPLGYEVTIFEKLDVTGGLMRSNIPRFRLPPKVLDEEINNILDMDVDLRLNSPIESMKALLEEGFDAVFVGAGAPRGKDLKLDGRDEAQATGRVHIGINWLESVAFEHIESIGEKVLIIGAGNTAMDCCRTSLRLGANDVRVMARKPADQLKASEWELEDALDEGVELMTCHSPKAFVVEDGQLKGMHFEVLEYFEKDGRQKSRVIDEIFLPCDDVILAIGQENAFPWIERDIGIEFDDWEVPVVDKITYQSTRPGVFFGGDAAFGPENIIWAVRHGHEAAISIHKYVNGEDITQRLPNAVDVHTVKMGQHEWAYSNQYAPEERRLVPHVDMKKRFKNVDIEVELGFGEQEWAVEVERCLNCDIQTIFFNDKCIECDACIDICPTQCLTMLHIEDGESEESVRSRLKVPAKNPDQAIYVSAKLPQTKRHMVKDEDQCVHCGLCAERCPTAAWDMKHGEVFIPKVGDEVEARRPNKSPKQASG
ncbi:FAD-dependent oxidoreductase [Gammaproteobacteria bacterium AB-CW1]|uniref:dihydrouracil dehydrogenase (NAD(+)) n=1 Tax=Natronospira elongata TaxID=3110268 RepID=A0AAP6MM10_9GAMM|nr:FAD-dependent oxidoreductase [Gammaproteobacteria bacterium AB-CW1]